MNPTVKWTVAFGTGTALLSAGALYLINSADNRLDVHADQKIDAQEGSVAPAREMTEEQRSAQQHYLSAVIFFQKGDVTKGRDELDLAARLDPENPEIAEALRRYGISVSFSKEGPGVVRQRRSKRK